MIANDGCHHGGPPPNPVKVCSTSGILEDLPKRPTKRAKVVLVEERACSLEGTDDLSTPGPPCDHCQGTNYLCNSISASIPKIAPGGESLHFENSNPGAPTLLANNVPNSTENAETTLLNNDEIIKISYNSAGNRRKYNKAFKIELLLCKFIANPNLTKKTLREHECTLPELESNVPRDKTGSARRLRETLVSRNPTINEEDIPDHTSLGILADSIKKGKTFSRGEIGELAMKAGRMLEIEFQEAVRLGGNEYKSQEADRLGGHMWKVETQEADRLGGRGDKSQEAVMLGGHAEDELEEGEIIEDIYPEDLDDLPPTRTTTTTNIQMSILAKQIRMKWEAISSKNNHRSQTEKTRLPRISRIEEITEEIVSINNAITEILTAYPVIDLQDVRDLTYAAATCYYERTSKWKLVDDKVERPKKPGRLDQKIGKWKKTIQVLRNDMRALQQVIMGKACQKDEKLVKMLRKKNGRASDLEIQETKRQLTKALARRIKKETNKSEYFRTNKNFETKTKMFFRKLRSPETNPQIAGVSDQEMMDYWRNLFERNSGYNSDSRILGEESLEGINPMECPDEEGLVGITLGRIRRLSSWKCPPSYWEANN
jgi:hypothetical protein